MTGFGRSRGRDAAGCRRGTCRLGGAPGSWGWLDVTPSWLLTGWPPCRSGPRGGVPAWAGDGPTFFSVLSAFPDSFCFSTALQPPGPLMDPLTKGSCGSQMAQTLLGKAKSSLSFGIQPLQTWPTKDPEVESQVNL